MKQQIITLSDGQQVFAEFPRTMNISIDGMTANDQRIEEVERVTLDIKDITLRDVVKTKLKTHTAHFDTITKELHFTPNKEPKSEPTVKLPQTTKTELLPEAKN